MGSSAFKALCSRSCRRRELPGREFVFSTGAQACAVAFVMWVRMLHPEMVSPPEHRFRSVELVSTPVPVNHQPQPPAAKPVFVAKLDPPTERLAPSRSAAKGFVKLEEVPAPKVSITPQKAGSTAN